jgi:hypothetical protein
MMWWLAMACYVSVTDLQQQMDHDQDGYRSEQFGGQDCDDERADVGPEMVEKLFNNVDENCDGHVSFDGDGDGVDRVPEGEDCDDSDPDVFPGADERCNGVDDNCDGQAEPDEDDDGSFACVDCDDANAAVGPHAAEICDDGNVDEDCDDLSDDDDVTATGQLIWYIDSDDDDFGEPSQTLSACDEPVGFANNDQDCDDANADVHPNSIWYDDVDGDGSGDSSSGLQTCVAPSPGSVLVGGDCDDTDPEQFPGQVWFHDFDSDGYGDENDDLPQCERKKHYVLDARDCNDEDSNEFPGQTWYFDGDGDKQGTTEVATKSRCSQPKDYVANSLDCNDGDPDEFEGQTWYVDRDRDGQGDTDDSVSRCSRKDGLVLNDDDCDDSDADAFMGQLWHPDVDGDGLGDPSGFIEQCSAPVGHVANADDCDDGDADVLASAQDWYPDEDKDGFGDVSADPMSQCKRPKNHLLDNTDCNDEDPEAFPGQTWFGDGDGDGFGHGQPRTQCDRPDGFVVVDGDCDDTNAEEFPDRIWFVDNDDDDHGNSDLPSVVSCEEPSLHAFVGGDCDDNDPDEFPSRTWWLDGDGDGFAGSETSEVACERPSADHYVDAADCDDQDDEEWPGQLWAPDTDDDGWGDDEATPVEACERPADYAVLGDCNDDAELANFDEVEVCNDGLDNDCDGTLNGCERLNLHDSIGFDTKWSGSILRDDDLNDVIVNASTTHIAIAMEADDASGFDASAIYLMPTADFSVPLFLESNWETRIVSPFFGEQPDDGWGETWQLATELVFVPDIDDDGIEDLLLSSPDLLGAGVGAAYILESSTVGEVVLDYSTSLNSVFPVGDDTDFGRHSAHAGDGWFFVTDEYNVYRIQLESGAWANPAEPINEVIVFADDAAPSDIHTADFDGDGTLDLAVGAADMDVGAGNVFLFLGPVDSGTHADADATLVGETKGLGASLSSGDLDGDGDIDLLARDGSPFTSVVARAYLEPLGSGEQVTFTGDSHGTFIGSGLSANGDLDMDGTDDPVLWRDETAYIFYGPVSGIVDFGDADAAKYVDSNHDITSLTHVPGDEGPHADLLVGSTYWTQQSFAWVRGIGY